MKNGKNVKEIDSINKIQLVITNYKDLSAMLSLEVDECKTAHDLANVAKALYMFKKGLNKQIKGIEDMIAQSIKDANVEYPTGLEAEQYYDFLKSIPITDKEIKA